MDGCWRKHSIIAIRYYLSAGRNRRCDCRGGRETERERERERENGYAVGVIEGHGGFDGGSIRDIRVVIVGGDWVRVYLVVS